MIPFEDIRRLKDRSWSIPLAELVERGQIEDKDEICQTIAALEDPRIPTRLLRVLEDINHPAAAREVAADALNECANVDTAEQRRAWWQSGDFLLMRHAIRMAERTETDLLMSVLADPSSLFYVDALSVIQWWEEPRFQQILMGALRHVNPVVRETAADCLVWEQPNDAAGDLLRLAADAQYGDVAIGAMNTLNYYSTQEVLLRFNELLLEGPTDLHENYQAGADYVREEFIGGCRWAMSKNSNVRDYLLVWLQPVLHLFKPGDFDAQDCEASISGAESANGFGSGSPEPLIAVDEMISDLDDANGCWADKISRYCRHSDWSWLTEGESIRLVQFLSAHKDPTLRQLACSIAGHRGLSDLLFELLQDPISWVQKSAAYNSRMIGCEQRFEERLWQLLIDPGTQGCIATEVLESYLVHTNDPFVNARLQKLALEDARPSVQAAAVSALQKRAARAEIDSVKHLLQAPLFNNWWLHRTLLDACAELKLSAKIDHLLSVDDVYLQVALAEYRVAMNR